MAVRIWACRGTSRGHYGAVNLHWCPFFKWASEVGDSLLMLVLPASRGLPLLREAPVCFVHTWPRIRKRFTGARISMYLSLCLICSPCTLSRQVLVTEGWLWFFWQKEWLSFSPLFYPLISSWNVDVMLGGTAAASAHEAWSQGQL